MTNKIRYCVEASADAGLLCRLIGFAAQRDHHALALKVETTGAAMTIELVLHDIDRHAGAVIAEKMARCFGVHSLTVDGVPLAALPPTARAA